MRVLELETFDFPLKVSSFDALTVELCEKQLIQQRRVTDTDFVGEQTEAKSFDVVFASAAYKSRIKLPVTLNFLVQNLSSCTPFQVQERRIRNQTKAVSRNLFKWIV